jgi:hypothetical protein
MFESWLLSRSLQLSTRSFCLQLEAGRLQLNRHPLPETRITSSTHCLSKKRITFGMVYSTDIPKKNLLSDNSSLDIGDISKLVGIKRELLTHKFQLNGKIS